MKKIFFSLLAVFMMLNLSGQGSFTDQRDGTVYKTITFDNVTWMGENLKYLPREGATIPESDSKVNLEYGVLYDWKTSTKVCPDGWHLPSDQEFQKMVNHFNQIDDWVNKGNSKSSFGIQLSGMKDYEGTFTEMDESCYLWSSTEYDKDYAEYFSYIVVVDTPVADISRKGDIADIHGAEKTNKYSARCVKN